MILGFGGLAFAGCGAEVPEEGTTTTLAYELGMSCEGSQGMYPLKAALAVAMSTEIGRIDPLNDLMIYEWSVHLTDGAKARCAARGYGDCPNTRAVLSMQDDSVNAFIDQGIFSATSFREELKSSFGRQRDHEANLARNQPELLPQAHELFEIGITDRGACGVHFDYAAVGQKVENIEQRMVFFGGSQNPFIDFRSSDGTISIDPTGTMNGDTSATSGMCVDGCYAYGTSRRGSCCSCKGHQGTFYRAVWNPSMVYCAY